MSIDNIIIADYNIIVIDGIRVYWENGVDWNVYRWKLPEPVDCIIKNTKTWQDLRHSIFVCVFITSSAARPTKVIIS